jgi:hypothetical protein
MRTLFLLAVAASSLVACAQQTSTPPTTFDVSLYPACDTQGGEPAVGQDGCVLGAEGVGHVILATKDEKGWTLQVVQDGQAGQVFEEPADPMQLGRPSLFDVNADGNLDLLIPKETGNVNTVEAVWLAGTPTNTYARVGEISGVNHELTADGLFAVAARSSASSWEVSFYRATPTALTDVASVTVEGQQSDENAPIETICVLTDSPGIAAMNLTQELAQTKFCAEPMAAGVFQ